MIEALLVAVGGFLGAVSRFGVMRWTQRKINSTFPLGTFTVNLVGSFALGWLLAWGFHESIFLFLGIGFMGSFTTFSTFAVENIQLWQGRKFVLGLVYAAGSIVCGVSLAFFGYWLGAAL